MPMFWVRYTTAGVYKVIENSNLNPEKNQHQSNHTFGRYINFELHNTKNSVNGGRVIFLLQNLDIKINIKNSILHACQKIEFSIIEIDSIKMTLSLATEKIQKVVKACQDLLMNHCKNLLVLSKVIGSLYNQ